ncbi:hypothetical protein BD779DRAFT_1490944 [Infundibulicybe gibba]|nr:hypothetical protein BD779DRAFT_1490944 [Infundibulicybe gibba]
MARNRKAKTSTTGSNSGSTQPAIEISDEEQWRLINQSGVLQKAVAPPPESSPDMIHENDEEFVPLAEELFNSVLLIIPFSFLLLMMEILIHQQYGRRASLQAIMDRMIPGTPILSIFVFYTTRYKHHRRMQFFLFILSILVGPRMIYLINHASWLVNMRQCPPLATLWVYTIVQLDLGPAVLNLITVGGFVWWKGLQLRIR